jgi:uncharacterized Fe-S cluster-containing radical SAM superfamily protein
MDKIKKLIELKLDILSHCKKTVMKTYVTGSIKEQQEKQIERLTKELTDLKVKPSIIEKA